MEIDYTGDCPVCSDWVDESDAGYCHICDNPFHWGSCGGWFCREHVCNLCIEAEDD